MRSPAHIPESDLVLLATGELSPSHIVAVNDHIAQCAHCRNELRAIERTLASYAGRRRAMLDPLLPDSDEARHMFLRRLAGAQSTKSSWFDGLSLSSAGLRWSLAVAALSLAAAFGILTSGTRPVDRSENAGSAPDPARTPGLATSASREELCRVESSDALPALSRALALDVFRAHGIRNPRPRAYEIDYLIPPELGGAVDIRNLWPQPYDAQPWNAHAKDALEDYLLRSVCEGSMDLAAAQRELANDWVAAYRKHFRTAEPLVEHAAFLKDEPWQ